MTVGRILLRFEWRKVACIDRLLEEFLFVVSPKLAHVAIGFDCLVDELAVRLFEMVHSIDSVPLAEELNRRAEQSNQVIKVMIEVNLSKETTKFGTDEEQLFSLARRIQDLRHLSLRGLMTMPPYFDSPEMSRPYYVALRELKEKMIREGVPLQELSMGMSNDFEIAVEEGATFVRVGTAIFGPRR